MNDLCWNDAGWSAIYANPSRDHSQLEWVEKNELGESMKLTNLQQTVNESHMNQPGSLLLFCFASSLRHPCCLFFGFLYLSLLFLILFLRVNFEAHQTTLLRKNHLNKRSSLSDHWHPPVVDDSNSRGGVFTFRNDNNKSNIFGEFRAVWLRSVK